jgi:hypothetical protein
MGAEPMKVLQGLVQTSFGGEKSTWELVHNLKRKKKVFS